MGAHSRAAPQVRVVYLITQAQPQLAAFLGQGPHGLPHCSCQHPQCLCGGKDLVSTGMWSWSEECRAKAWDQRWQLEVIQKSAPPPQKKEIPPTLRYNWNAFFNEQEDTWAALGRSL